ncbi:MAG: tRNA (guanosine(46)-N7)-methyltransferase TrmB [Alphaproteobacteria bacterium]|nr:tRNA (guanosine(46)-N7)-methyltransferase TrmB [Alphaproteobacteria bacterium]
MNTTSREAGRNHGPLRSFGRRRARKLTSRQSTLLDSGLQRYRIDLSSPTPSRLELMFHQPVDEVWLEIGFGGGEHLLWQAEHHPKVGFVACEPFIDGVAKVMDGIVTNQLENVRIHADDARDVLPWLPPASIARVFILFPDPWPKKRHIKRRLVQPALIADLARVVRAGGELRLATDIPDYARGMLQAVRREGSFRWTARGPQDWRNRPADWPATRYEQKALREGRACHFLRFKRLPRSP